MSHSFRIAVDLPWDASAHMGTGAYSETMVRALAELDDDIELFLVVNADAPRTIQFKNVHYHAAASKILKNEGYRQVVLPSLLEKLKIDCLFAPATLLPTVKICAYVPTVHDLTFIEHPDYYAPGLVAYLMQWFEPSIRMADQIISISDETKLELERMGVSKDRIAVVHQPIRQVFKSRLTSDEISFELDHLKLKTPFFFHISNLAPHKNIEFSINVFKAYRDLKPSANHMLVIAGGGISPNFPTDPMLLARKLGVEDRVKFVGRVNDTALKALYQSCDGFLFPSLAEGWGLPAAEASAMGARVFASTYVPALPLAQRLPLDVPMWVNALNNRSAVVPISHHTTSIAAGRAILSILKAAAESFSNQPNAVVASPKCVVEVPRGVRKPARSIIAHRGDWFSPSGFGESARSTYSALKQLPVAVVPVSVAKDRIQIAELFNQPVVSELESADIWFHQIPPDWIDLKPSGRHVAHFVWETDRLPTESTNPSWIKILNDLDEVWVPAEFLRTVLSDSGVMTPAYVLPQPIDADFWTPGPNRFFLNDPPKHLDSTWTVFLFVGTWDARKRPDLLIRAFDRAFNHDDNALLIVKSYVTGNVDKDRQILENWTKQSHNGSAHIRVVPEILSVAEMLNLYRFSSIFVTASRGEGCCLPALQAMSCGKASMGVNWSAFKDYISIPLNYRLAGIEKEVGLPGYHSDMRWAEVDENDLSAKLQWVHGNRRAVSSLGRNARQWILEHASIPAVQNRLSERVKSLLNLSPSKGK